MTLPLIHTVTIATGTLTTKRPVETMILKNSQPRKLAALVRQAS